MELGSWLPKGQHHIPWHVPQTFLSSAVSDAVHSCCSDLLETKVPLHLWYQYASQSLSEMDLQKLRVRIFCLDLLMN